MFTIFGENLGPSTPVVVSQFPLSRTFQGVSVRVTVGATTVDAIPVVVWTNQVSAVLPSTTPAGDGTVQLTYNGQPSNPFPIRVVAHALGIFAINQAGNGPGVFTEAATYTVNTLTTAARPGEQWDIWATGLGAVQGDEAAGPLPGNLPYNVQVWVGGRQAQVVYKGRSGCCAGIDQIRFVVPQNVRGCYVPVTVLVEGVPSNTVTMSIDPDGGACSEPGLFTEQELTSAQQNNGLRIGTIALWRSVQTVSVPGFGEMDVSTDTGNAAFVRFDYRSLIGSTSSIQFSTLTGCYVYQFRSTEAADLNDVDPSRPTYLDAGPAINVSGPRGSKQLLPNNGVRGSYSAQLGGGGVGPIPGQPPFLEPGQYSLNNGSGGADVGPFNFSATLAQPVNWTNKSQLNSVPLTQPLQLTWTGGGPQDYVYIVGTSMTAVSPGQYVGAAFVCGTPASSGGYTVPVAVLAALPASGQEQGLPLGFLQLETLSPPVRFTAPGLDIGNLFFGHIQTKNLSFTR